MTTAAAKTLDISTDAALAARARSVLKRRKAGPELDSIRLCAVVASLPACVKVRDVAALYGLTPTSLSKLRGQAYRQAVRFPDAFRPALEASFTPRAKA